MFFCLNNIKITFFIFLKLNNLYVTYALADVRVSTDLLGNLSLINLLSLQPES